MVRATAAVNVFNYLYDVIIEKQPEVVALDNSDVVSTVGPAVKGRIKYIGQDDNNHGYKFCNKKLLKENVQFAKTNLPQCTTTATRS